MLVGSVEQGIYIWCGILYVVLFVGLLCWCVLQLVVCWQGVCLVEIFFVVSWQDIDYCCEFGGGDSGVFSEDCLYFNVWVLVSVVQLLLVMVWLYGGGFIIGVGSLLFYDGKVFVSCDVVVVIVNYWLGYFGFFVYLVLEEEVGECFYNFVLFDQIVVLQWVQENIYVFGGDVVNVMLFGEFVGVCSVLLLMVFLKVKGLFYKVIIQSGYMLFDLLWEKVLEKGCLLVEYFVLL